MHLQPAATGAGLAQQRSSPTSVHQRLGGHVCSVRGRRWPCAGHPPLPTVIYKSSLNAPANLSLSLLIPRAIFFSAARIRTMLSMVVIIVSATGLLVT